MATGYPKKGTETGSKWKILVWSRKNRNSSHCQSSLIIKSYVCKTLMTAFSLSAHKKTFTTYIGHVYLMYCNSLLITLLFQIQQDDELNWTLGHWPSKGMSGFCFSNMLSGHIRRNWKMLPFNWILIPLLTQSLLRDGDRFCSFSCNLISHLSSYLNCTAFINSWPGSGQMIS